jgi:hypothetical protein
MNDVDAVDLALAEKLEGLAAAMRRGDVAGIYLAWADMDGQIGIIHTGDSAVEMAENTLAMTCELITVGEMN